MCQQKNWDIGRKKQIKDRFDRWLHIFGCSKKLHLGGITNRKLPHWLIRSSKKDMLWGKGGDSSNFVQIRMTCLVKPGYLVREGRNAGIYAPSNAASEIVSPVGRLVVSNLELFSWMQRKTLSYLKGISPLPTHFLVSIFLGFLPLFFACQSLPFPGHRCAGSMEGGSERCWRWNTWRSEKKT